MDGGFGPPLFVRKSNPYQLTVCSIIRETAPSLKEAVHEKQSSNRKMADHIRHISCFFHHGIPDFKKKNILREEIFIMAPGLRHISL